MKHVGLFILVFVLLFVTGLCVAGVYAWQVWGSAPAEDPSVLFADVKRGYFLHEVTERGSIDSASNVEVRCQVESPQGVMIIWVIPEGTHVKKGDLLCELDSSNLQEKMTQQEITAANSGSKVKQSEANLKVAELAYKEYAGKLPDKEPDEELDKESNQENVVEGPDNKPGDEPDIKSDDKPDNKSDNKPDNENGGEEGNKIAKEEIVKEENGKNDEDGKNDAGKGLYDKELATIENKISKANEEWNQAENKLRHTKRLLAQEFVTDIQLRADEEAAKQRLYDKKVAELEKEVLVKYTREKTLTKLKADIDTARIQLQSDQKSHGLDVDRLAYYKKQVGACKVKAPEDGQVVYATHPWRIDEVIKEGTFVRDRQIIIKLPDPNQMQVKGYVNEASVSLVKLGQPARIELEAMSGRFYSGKVKQVNDYPEPDNFLRAIKEYQTIVTMDDIPEAEKSMIRSGLTAKVKVTVDERNDALMVPVQCLFEYAKKIYCVTYQNGVWDKVEVGVSATNNEMAVIASGLNDGDRVVMGAWKYRDKVDLPPLGEGEQERQFGTSSIKREEETKKDEEKKEEKKDEKDEKKEEAVNEETEEVTPPANPDLSEEKSASPADEKDEKKPAESSPPPEKEKQA